MKICVASNNKNKIKQFGEIFASCGIDAEFVTSGEIGFRDYPPEDADTFYGNSKIKADAVFAYIKENHKGEYAVIADDSGLIVDALDGAPGVKSARYASTNDVDDASDEDNNKKLISEMKRVLSENPDVPMTSRYKSVVYMIFPDGKAIFADGTVEGLITFDGRGTNGFGYDPYFFVESFGKTLAELSSDERNGISHRGNAIRNLVASAEFKKYF